MDRQWISATLLFALLGVFVTGCSSSLKPSGNPLSSLFGSSKSQTPFANELADNRQRPIVSPVFGAQKVSEPTVTSRLVSAVTKNPVSEAVTGAVKKSTAYLTPKPKVVKASDPLSITNGTKPPGPDFFVQMAHVSEKAQKLPQAEQFYQRAIDAAPDDLPALLGYAHLLDRQNRFEEATDIYVKAIRKHPHSAKAHNDLALCYARRNMLSQSLQELERAVAINPNNARYRNNIAIVLMQSDRIDDAMRHLLAVNPPAVAHNNLACLLLQRGRKVEAARHFAEAARLDPSLKQAQYGMTLANQATQQYAVNHNTMSSPQSAPRQINRYQAVNPNGNPTAYPAGRYANGQPAGWQAPVAQTASASSRYSSGPVGSTPSSSQYSLTNSGTQPQPLPPVSSAAPYYR